MNDDNPEVFSGSDPATQIDAELQAASVEPGDSSAEPSSPRDSNSRGRADDRKSQNSGNGLKGEDAWLFIEVLRQRWAWIVAAAVLCAGLGYFAARTLFKPGFSASTRLIRTDSPRTAEVFKYQTLTPQTFVDILRSPDLLARVAERARPPVPVDKLAKRIRLTPEHEGDVVVAELPGGSKQDAIDLANLYATEAVRYTQELQAHAAVTVREFLEPQLAEVEAEITAKKQQERPSIPKPLLTGPPRPSPTQTKLDAARDELAVALTLYKEAHPEVQALRAKIASFQNQLTNGLAIPAAPTEAEITGQFAAQRDAWEMMRNELAPLEATRRTLLERRSAADLVKADPPGYYRIFSLAEPRDVKGNSRELKIAAITVFLGVAGCLGAVLLVLLIEFLDQRIKGPSDIARVTGLRVVATAPDLGKMTPIEKRNWAFRTWTNLHGRLNSLPNHGLVCGITSSGHGEGRSTWIKLLARAASESGFRVLTVTTRHDSLNGPPQAEAVSHTHEGTPPNGELHNGENHNHHGATNGSSVPGTSVPEKVLHSLPTPMEVENKLVGPQSQPVVHIPLPGWVWNLERRKQWQSALSEWGKIENVVILVELPPASMPEAVLLAEQLPNLVWLADSGNSRADETRAQLEVLRDARCNLVGAVLNHATANRTRRRLARWVASGLLLLSLNEAGAQTETPVPPAAGDAPVAVARTNRFLEVTPPLQRAAWQQRFTLGPGDVLRIGLYGHPETFRAEVIVAPDGRVGYLEALDVKAAGLTIDEFRAQLDQELTKYRTAPRAMITPVTFRSKKYCVLGKVVQRGIYALDHPMTVLEAVARAKGFEIALRDHDSIDLVDLERSFLMRQGKRMPVNFEKMFLDGDLSQNIAIEPGDYLFFPATGVKEVHVVGDVRYPGPVVYTPGISVISAISQRAGFNEKAYRSKVLVIRGSFDDPQTFVVDTKAVLAAEATDFKLEPKDIVYVAQRPWWRAEDLLDMAISAFLQSLVANTVDQEVIQPVSP